MQKNNFSKVIGRPPVLDGRGASPGSGDKYKSERELLLTKDLLTVREVAIYTELSERNIRQKMDVDKNFPEPIKLYGRVYYKREIIDLWLDERNRKKALNDGKRTFMYTVTKISTGAVFTIEAKHLTHARRIACKADGLIEDKLPDYRAKRIKKPEGGV